MSPGMRSDSDSYRKDKHEVLRNFNSAADGYDSAAVLQKTVADRLLERIEIIRLDPARILDLGSGTGMGARQLHKNFRKSQIIQMDFAWKMLAISLRQERRLFSRQSFACADAQCLPFAPGVFDMIYSNLMLQWCNDLDAVFSEVQRISRPGGLFIFSSFGPDTLHELRESWSAVDDDIHVNTFLDMHEVGDALVRAGFENPIMEVEYFTLTYVDVSELLRELKQLGANNTNSGRRRSLTGKDRLKQMIAAYERFRVDDRVPATYEVVYGHAWRSEAGGRYLPEDGAYRFPVSAIKKRMS